MLLHAIFGIRKHGESPELLDCWDDCALDENGEGFDAKLAALNASGEFMAVRVIVLDAPSRAIKDAFTNAVVKVKV